MRTRATVDDVEKLFLKERTTAFWSGTGKAGCEGAERLKDCSASNRWSLSLIKLMKSIDNCPFGCSEGVSCSEGEHQLMQRR